MTNNNPIEKIAPRSISVWKRKVQKFKSGRDRIIENEAGKKVSKGSYYVNVPAPVADAFGVKKGSEIKYKQVVDSTSGNVMFVIDFD
jgi:hypothetical protein